MRGRRVGRIVGCGLLALGATLCATGGALADDAPAPTTSQALTLVTLTGPGTSAGTRETADLLARVNLQVFVFDTPGQIQGAFTLPFTDIRPNSEKVGVFQLARSACAGISRVLINDITDCAGAGAAPIAGCGTMFAASSRAAIPLQY